MSNFSIQRDLTVSSIRAGKITFSNGTVVTQSTSSDVPANIHSLEDGQIFVTDTSVTASSRIFVTRYGTRASVENPGFLVVSSVTPGSGYTVQSLDGRGRRRMFDNASFFSTIFPSSVVTGTGSFSSGEVTITEATATPSSIIMVSRQGAVTGNEPGHIYVSDRSAGSFDIKSYDGDDSIRSDDDSEIVWAVINTGYQSGVATIEDGVVTISASGITNNSKVQITREGTDVDEPNHLHISKIRPGKNFTVQSREGSDGEANDDDNGEIMWIVIP